MPIPTNAFSPPSIDDRKTWDAVRNDPARAEWLAGMDKRLSGIPETPPQPTAADYLAARRANDRKRIDGYWQNTRADLGMLAANRLFKGIEKSDPDDRLLNWLYSYTFEPTWTVSAHSPKNDLPLSGAGQLDLAGCEQAGALAELAQSLKPWIDTQSQTLVQSMLNEIDRRVVTPAEADTREFWMKTDGTPINNWAGVCAGSILCACATMESFGMPRPKTRERMIEILRAYFQYGFTEAGECDEGIGYWNYGMDFAFIGLSRLRRDEIESKFDLDRIKLIASYPQRVHMVGRTFFVGNDGSPSASPSLGGIPLVAEWFDMPFLKWWCGQAKPTGLRTYTQLLRYLTSTMTFPSSQSVGPKHEPNRYLADQQAGIFQRESRRGLFIFTLTGGTNAEQHNHNDLGTFQVFLDEKPIIPDLGAPIYQQDFFGAARYTKWIVAMSSGHCCPQINGIEQRAGKEAAGKLLAWDDKTGELALDLTSAYPENAGLTKWTRVGHVPMDDAMAIMDDEFVLKADGEVVHRIWFAGEPKVTDDRVLESEGIVVSVQTKPEKLEVVPFKANDERLMLRIFPATHTLNRVDMTYRTNANVPLKIQTVITVV
jgi:hypothetical protein